MEGNNGQSLAGHAACTSCARRQHTMPLSSQSHHSLFALSPPSPPAVPHSPQSLTTISTTHVNVRVHAHVHALGATDFVRPRPGSFPAAAFKHGDCLRYMNPLNVPLTPIRDTIVIFGYACWGSVVVIGFASLCGLVLHGVVYTLLVASEWLCMRRPRALRRWRTVMEPCVALHRGIFYTDENSCCGPFGHVFGLYLALAAVPMFIAGGCLGVLVILGQGSKDEPQEIFAAALLLVDVLFKLAATLCCDLAGASLRRTRRRAAPAFAPRRRRRRLHVADGADAAVEGPTRTADVESTTVGAQDDAAIEMPALVPAPVPVHPDDSGWSATTASSPTSTQGNGEAAEALSEARGRAMCAVRSRPSSPSSARVAPAAGRARAAHMSQGRQHV